MKKLITILLTTFFICTASYGATIKELLGGKKSLTLSCVIEKSSYLDPNLKEHDDTMVGIKMSFKIVPTEVSDDGSGEGDLYDDGIKVTDGKTNYLIITKDLFSFSGDIGNGQIKYIKINRVNGAFRMGGNPRIGGSVGMTSMRGTCEKVTKNKF